MQISLMFLLTWVFHDSEHHLWTFRDAWAKLNAYTRALFGNACIFTASIQFNSFRARFLPSWLAINKATPPQFWIFVNELNPNDVFRVILCPWGVLCHRAQSVWWCEGIEQLLFNSFRERMIANHTLRTGVYSEPMKIVATSNNQDTWIKFS
jgi:hypothetical protein